MTARLFLLLGLALMAATFAQSGATEKEEPSFYVQLLREVKKQEQALQGKSLPELAAKFVEDARTIGKEVVSVLRDAMTVASGGDASEVPKKNKEKSIVDLVTEILATTTAHEKAVDDETEKASSRKKRDISKADISSLLQQLLAAQQQQQRGEADSISDAGTRDGGSTPSSANGVSTRLGAPAPVVLIPGPPGKPSVPGIPGFSGKNGKIPNFRGLKAILTTRVAELLAYLAFMAVASIAKFLGLLGLLLGLALPIYGKLKSAGIVLPEEALSARRKRSLLPIDRASSSAHAVSYVLRNIDQGQRKFL